MPWKVLLAVLPCAVCLMSCMESTRGRCQPPPWIDDGWQTASLEDVGIDAEMLCEAIDRIDDNTYENVHSILIIKDGKLVLEEYFAGYRWAYEPDQYRGERVEFGIGTIHNLASVTKAVTSALVGIAIDHGFIKGVDEEVSGFFPDYVHLFDDTKERITLRHLLTMSSGLEWNEGEYSYGDSRNDLIRLFSVRDPIEYILSRPIAHQPGTTYYYSGGDVNLLAEIVKRATGQRLDAFGLQYLFAPLGITQYKWDFINADVIHASGNLQLCPRDVAKFGYLYWDNGAWQGQQIISKAWIEESTREPIPIPGSPDGDRYGYQWRLTTYHVGSTPIQAFYKAGWGGQRVTVFPDLDMIVVFTGGNYAEKDPVDEITVRYILPAVR